MKLDTKNISKLLTKYLVLLKNYTVFIFIITGLGIFGFLVLRIRTLAAREPSESMITEKSSQSKPVNIDESAVKKIEQLRSTNVEVKALFEQTRDNPFQE